MRTQQAVLESFMLIDELLEKVHNFYKGLSNRSVFDEQEREFIAESVYLAECYIGIHDDPIFELRAVLDPKKEVVCIFADTLFNYCEDVFWGTDDDVMFLLSLSHLIYATPSIGGMQNSNTGTMTREVMEEYIEEIMDDAKFLRKFAMSGKSHPIPMTYGISYEDLPICPD